jgi:hypothetical protein
MKIFENLNSEKPTPAFLALTKNKSEGRLSQICNNTNTPFENDAERNAFITEEFAKIYNPAPTPPLPDDVIEQFLGEEICNNDIVKNSKLMQAERDWLDRPFTMQEIDIAAEKGKNRSAPGADGFSNLLIKKC